MTEKIPFFRPPIDTRDEEAMLRVLRSGWLTSGPEVRAFEKEIAAYHHAGAALCVNSGTAALGMALDSLNLEPGDEVLLSPLGFIAGVEVLLERGLVPRFIDVSAETLQIAAEGIQSGRTKKTRALILVSIGGDPRGLVDAALAARAMGIKVVFDAAHAFEAAFENHKIDTLFDRVAFSFYSSKNLTCGEGGALVLANQAQAETLGPLRSHGMTRASRERDASRRPWDYDVTQMGHKYNLPDLLAALGRSQLARMDELWLKRREHAQTYRDALRDVPELALPSESPGARHAWHLFAPRLLDDRPESVRDALLEELVQRGIGVSVHFRSLTTFTAIKNASFGAVDCPVAEDHCQRTFSLPLYCELTSQDVHRVAHEVASILKDLR